MADRIAAGGLQVDKKLYDFINEEALPGTGVSPEAFWSGFDRLVHGLAPRNRELLVKREDLQRRIDAWYRENHDEPIDLPEYKAMLQEIGYLVPEGEDFSATTANVDPEISTIAGPQLVVPLTNERYALNAANARWGSLYDAFYGTDAIPEDDGCERTAKYNPVRGARVIARSREFLDAAAPLAAGSHAGRDGLRRRRRSARRDAEGRRHDGPLRRREVRRGTAGTPTRRRPSCSGTTISTSRSPSIASIPSAGTTTPASRTSSSRRRPRRSWTWRTRWRRSTPRTRWSPTGTGSG